MGSLSWEISRGVNARDEVLGYVREVLTHATVVDHAFATADSLDWGGVMFAAVTNTADHPSEPDITWAAVVLFSVNNERGSRWLCVKFLDETVGPYEVNMPMRILRRLSATDHEYAVAWRGRVEQFHARRRAARRTIGRTITFSVSLTYGEPVGEISRVTVKSLTQWFDPVSHRMLRPPAHWWQRDYTVDRAPVT